MFTAEEFGEKIKGGGHRSSGGGETGASGVASWEGAALHTQKGSGVSGDVFV